MRRIFALLIIICICCTSASFLAVADTDWSARLSVEQTSSGVEDSLVSIRISICDITSQSGIICAIYSLHFDQNCLEYISHENGLPQNWSFGDSNALVAQDWSQLISEDGEEPYFYYTVFNEEAVNGVTDSDTLYTDITFRVKDSSATSTEISISEISLTDAEGLYQNYSLELPDMNYSLQLHTNEPDDDASDDTASEETSSESTGFESQETPDDTSSAPETPEFEIVSTDILLYDIKDSSGVSSIEFELSFDPNILEFQRYEFIRPAIWIDDESYTEDLSQTAKASEGTLFFCALNIDENCGVKEDGVLGFRVFFRAKKGTVLDSSYFVLNKVFVYNASAQVEEITADNYKLVIGNRTPEKQYHSADILFKTNDAATGVYDLQFVLSFDPKLSSFVKYEIIFADGTADQFCIEDLSQLDSAANGELFFHLTSTDQNRSISQAGFCGIRVYVEMKNDIQFDPSIFTVKSPVAKDAAGNTLDSDVYTLYVDGKEDEKSFWDTTKVTIMIIAVVIVVVSGILVAYVYGRKKKKQ